MEGNGWKPTISNVEFKKFVDSLIPLMRFGDDSHLGSFEVPVGPQTKCRVTFTGPVDSDIYDSLLAHIAFYKTLLPKDGEKPFTQSDARALMQEAIDRAFPKTPGATP